MSEDIDRLKRNPAVLRMYAQRLQLSRYGKDDYVAKCCFHDDRNPSFHVNLKDGVWLWHCFACNVGGDIFQFLERKHNVNFQEAKKMVQNFVGDYRWESDKAEVEEVFQPAFAPANEEKKIITLEAYERSGVEAALATSDKGRVFLSARGISLETAKSLHFGYRESISCAGGEAADVAGEGWLVLPCVVGERVVSIQYRSVVRKAFRWHPGMAPALFNVPDIDIFEPLYITEGILDTAVTKQAGFRVIAIPNAGFNLTPEMKDAILQASVIYLAGDNDKAGNEAMDKLWKELKERTYRIEWPDNLKDANDVYMSSRCKGQVDVFRELVLKLSATAKSKPMPGIYSLQEAMRTSDVEQLSDHPKRLHFPWPSVDKMVNLLPGSVLSLYASQTGMGKTTLVMNVLVYDARKYGEVVLNYSAELSTDEYANLVTAHILKKDRNTTTKEDRALAAAKLGGARFYIGYNPDLTRVEPVLDLIEAGIRRLGATVVVLDHLHFVTRNETDTIKAQENAMQRIKNISREYGVKFIVVGQPRKSVQQYRGKPVHITDAKGSESYTSDADAVVAMHREMAKVVDPQHPPREPYESKTKIFLQKGRSQGAGNAYTELEFAGNVATFCEVDTAHTEAPPEPQQQPLKNVF